MSYGKSSLGNRRIMHNIRVRLNSVKARISSHDVEGDFDHLVAYSMACTLESGDVCNGRISFRSLDEVMNGDVLECLGQGKT